MSLKIEEQLAKLFDYLTVQFSKILFVCYNKELRYVVGTYKKIKLIAFFSLKARH